ncbi:MULTISPECIES: hypothetical protein [unclassified Methylobacterium]|uniref:hypothetical protein n=1 Tax=unclassified Methylobacterium TaxID=2615210 RepID=UPI0011C1E155|nr:MULTISPECIES: hypothetical protein [unclassified Methylobacterium]QEE41006.1 hypothetical protein FVA80_20540 [Methylobacterium sp. WL1]TXN58853.1 hypothetical protein FV241_04535 [Methylobacterium sp. WL2]
MSGNSQESAAPKARYKLAERLRAAIGEQLGQAMGHACKGGPKPKMPEIITRKDRPVDGEPQCCLRTNGKVRSLGLPASRRGEAEAALAIALMTRRLEDDGKVRASEVTLGEIIDWRIDQTKPAANSSKREGARYRGLKGRLDTLKRLLGARKLRGIDEKSVTGYVNTRMLEPNATYNEAETAPRVSEATARNELGDLRRAIEAFHRQFVLDWTPVIDDRRRRNRRTFLLTRNGMARVLMASRGYVWDPHGDGYHVILVGGHRDPDARFKRVFLKGRGGWKTETVEDPETGETVVRYVRRTRKTVRHRRAVARLALVGVYSGTRHGALTGLSWVLHKSRGCIDVVNDTIHRRGHGEDAREGKPRWSSVMRPKLGVFADIWLRADNKRHIDFVIHHPDGTQYNSHIQDTWWETVADAGLPHLQVHHLRHAAVTWMMLDGRTVYETAQAIGLSVRTIQDTYLQSTLAGQKVNRRWGRDHVAKGWDTVETEDPAAEAYHARMNRPRPLGAQRVRRNHQKPLAGRSVRQPLRRRKPLTPRRGPRAS